MIDDAVTRLLAASTVLLAMNVAACVFEPTQVRVMVDTDLPASDPLVLRATVARGSMASVSDGGGAFAFHRGPDAGRDASLSFPASFAVVPGPGEPRDEAVTLVVEIQDGAMVLRRIARFRFMPQRSQLLRLFLSTRCLQMIGSCGGMPCTVQAQCERQGQTCNEDGQCVESATTLVSGREFTNDAAVNDLGDHSDTSTTDIAPPASCGDHTCNNGENACSCPGDCMPRAGDGCCSSGETQCSDSACPAAGGDGCCSPGENHCSDTACPVVNGDGCCTPGENNCNEGACPVMGGDGCCSPGETNCSDGACPVQGNDGCCSPGETNCNEGACPAACGDGCCTGGETCRTCRGDCGGFACDCYLRCCNGVLVGPIVTDSAGDCQGQYANCTGMNSHVYRAERGGVCIYGRHASPCPSPDCTSPFTTSCTTGARYCSTSDCNPDCP